MAREIDILTGIPMDETCCIDLVELTRLCGLENRLLVELVDEGVLQPAGSRPQEWVFSGIHVARARRAARLMRDLELTVAATALVLDLLDELELLRQRARDLELQVGGRRSYR